MDFHDICDCFGGSIFVEDPRHDPSDAATPRKPEGSIDWTENIEYKISSELLRAVRSIILQGEARHGMEILQELGSLIQSKLNIVPSRWLYRTNTYLLLSATHLFYPPLCRLNRVARGPSSVTFEDAAAPLELARRFIAANGSLEQGRDPISRIDQFEFDTVLCTFMLSHAIHKMPQKISHNHRDSTFNDSTKPDMVCSLTSRTVRVSIVASEAIKLDLSAVSTYLDRLLLELIRVTTPTNFEPRMLVLHEKLQHGGDVIGMASWHMFAGDNIACGPQTTPLFLGDYDFHGLIDHEYVFRADPREVEDHSALRVRFHVALDHYTQAELIYKASEIKRGEIQALLRKAGLIQMLMFESSAMDATSGMFHQAAHAIMGRVESLQRAAGDRTLSHIFTVLDAIWAAQAPLSYSVESLKVSGKSHNSVVLIRSLGILAHTVAHHYRYKCGLLEPAIRCLELACRVFRTNGHEIGPGSLVSCEVDSTQDLAQLLCSCGLYEEARIHADNVRRQLEPLQVMYDSFAKQYPEKAYLYEHEKIHSLERRLESFSRVFMETLYCAPPPEALTDTMLHAARLLKNKIATGQDDNFLATFAGDFAFLRSEERLRVMCGNGRLGLNVREALKTHIDTDWPGSLGLTRLVRSVQLCIELDEVQEAQRVARDGMRLAVAKCFESLQPVMHTEVEAFFCGAATLEPYSTVWLAALRCCEICLVLGICARLWPSAKLNIDRLETLSPGFSSGLPALSNIWPWQRCLWRGLVHENCGELRRALQLYNQSFQLGLKRLALVNDVGRYRSLFNLPDKGRILTSIARLYLKLKSTRDDLPSPEVLLDLPRTVVVAQFDTSDTKAKYHAEECAIVVLETSKARYLLDMLAFNAHITTDEEQKQWLENFRDYNCYIELRDRGPRRDELENCEFQELRQRIGRLEHFVQYHTNPAVSGVKPIPQVGIAEIQHVIDVATIIVYTSISTDGLALFCFDRQDVLHSSWNSNITQSFIFRQVSTYLGLMNEAKVKADVSILNSISGTLSTALIEPIAQHVRDHHEIIFVCSGDLSRLPLGALILDGKPLTFSKQIVNGSNPVPLASLRDGKPLAISKHVYQTPSLSFYYYHKTDKYSPTIMGRLSAIAKPGTKAEENRRGGEGRLAMGGIEALVATNLFGDGQPLNAGKMSRGDFRKVLQSGFIVHVCTHGYFPTGRPMQARISLKETLRVVDLIGVQSKAKAVIFSSCLTGMGRAFSNDDIAGFPHAILACGVKVFAGCLWKANDLTTLLHMTIFYSAMRLVDIAKGNAFHFVQLWNWATRMLAALDVVTARKLLHLIVRMWDSIAESGCKPGSFVKAGRGRLIDAIKHLTTADGTPSIDFSHPYVWASFSLVGYADFCIEVGTKNDRSRAVENIRQENHCDSHDHIHLDLFDINDLFIAMSKDL
ncbi:hypothetical protein LTR50_007702 [Elasticomyces elasticus]|nr:hypothetical protein LTR50_007702 [Elasticomyces elasticus]